MDRLMVTPGPTLSAHLQPVPTLNAMQDPCWCHRRWGNFIILGYRVPTHVLCSHLDLILRGSPRDRHQPWGREGGREEVRRIYSAPWYMQGTGDA